MLEPSFFYILILKPTDLNMYLQMANKYFKKKIEITYNVKVPTQCVTRFKIKI